MCILIYVLHSFPCVEINEFSWTASSDHLLVASGATDVGSIQVLRFDPGSAGVTEDVPEATVPATPASLTTLSSIYAHAANCYCLKVHYTTAAAIKCSYIYTANFPFEP